MPCQPKRPFKGPRWTFAIQTNLMFLFTYLATSARPSGVRDQDKRLIERAQREYQSNQWAYGKNELVARCDEKNLKRMLMRQSTVRTSILDVWRFVFCSPENLTELHEVILQWFVRAVVVCIKKENRGWGQNEFHADPTRKRQVCRLQINHYKNVQLLNQLFGDLCLP